MNKDDGDDVDIPNNSCMFNTVIWLAYCDDVIKLSWSEYLFLQVLPY